MQQVSTRPQQSTLGKQLPSQPLVKPTAHSSIGAHSKAAAAPVKQEQSEQVVQTLLLGSLSCLAFLRGIFPERCFDNHYYKTGDSIPSYDDFAHGDASKSPRSHQRPGTSLMVLRPGRSRSADKFLDWLRGAFEALNKHVLRALQLDIFEDPNNPTHVLETYTFTFAYARPSGGTSSLSSMEIKGPTGEVVTARKATHSLQMFVRKIISLCATLPDLPARRNLKMMLFYTDDCDPNYEPPGFVKSVSDTVVFPSGPAVEKSTTGVGQLDSGHHRVSLKVSYVNVLHGDEGATPGSDRLRIPSNLEYTSIASRESDMDMDMLASEQSQPSGTGSLGSEVAISVPNGTTQDGNSLLETPTPAPRHPRAVMTSEALSQNSQVAGDSLGATASQQRKDAQDKAALEQMLEPSLQDSGLEPTQLRDTILVTNPLSQYPGGRTTQLQLSQRRIQDLHEQAPLIERVQRTAQRDLELGPEARNKRKDVVSCQCGWGEEELDMIHCEFCDTWQHVHCYGYRSSTDPRIPTVHACYQCLLSHKEAPLLRELKDLALLRKGAHIIIQRGLDTKTTFADLLHCDIQTADNVARHFKQQGYLIATPGSHRRGFSQLGLPRFHAVTSGPKFDRMMREYFDPTAKIAHHFELPEAGTVDTHLSTQISLPPDGPAAVSDSQPGTPSQHHKKDRPLNLTLCQPAIDWAARDRDAQLRIAAPPSTPNRIRKAAEDAQEELAELRTGNKRMRRSVTGEYIGLALSSSPSTFSANL